MSLLVLLAAVVLITVVPVVIAAKFFDAKNTGIFACFVAVIGSVAADQIASTLIENPGFSILLAFIFTAIFYSVILGTDFGKGLVIALLAIGVQFVVANFLLGAGIATGVMTESNP